MAKAKVPARKGGPVVVGASISFLDDIAAELKIAPMRQKVKLLKVEDKRIQARILGAAAASAEDDEATIEEIAKQVKPGKMREMTDPYLGSTRKDFATEAMENPTLRQALSNRVSAFFKNGFHLELKLKSMRDANGNQFTPEQVDAELTKLQAEYNKFVKQIEDWMEERDIMVLQKMKTADIATLIQGRSLTLIFPAISKLAPGQLPVSLKTISYEDTGNPVIDIQFWRLLAVRLINLQPKTIATLDEMVYLYRDDWGQRKDSAFFGTALMEAILQACKIYKKVINYDFAKAAVAAYITRLLLLVPLDGMTDAQKQTKLNSIINDLTTSGTDLVGLEALPGTEIKPVPVTVDWNMLNGLVDKLENILISNGGSTKSQMGRTENLNYANAHIQEIAFIKYKRDPDEEFVKTGFENDLFNPLLAHLAGKPGKEIPVRIVIVRDEPVDKDKDNIDDSIEGEIAEDKAQTSNVAGTKGKAIDKSTATPQTNTPVLVQSADTLQ